MAITLQDPLSDKSVLARRAAIVSKNRQYTDLDLSLQLYPIVREEGQLGDINPLIDIDAVKASVKNLILTNYNERPFQPKLGSNLRALLFEPADRLTAVAIRESIKRVIAQYEPRVDSVTVQILDDSDRNRYHVTIGFRVITIDTEVNISVYLVRLR
jgi:phage baseplate assembly protein W